MELQPHPLGRVFHNLINLDVQIFSPLIFSLSIPWFNFIYSYKWYSLCKTRKHFFPVQCLLPLNKKAQSSVSFGAWPNYIPRFFFLSFLFFTSLPAFNPSSDTLRPPEGHCSEKRLQMLNCIDLITKKHIPYSLQKKV